VKAPREAGAVGKMTVVILSRFVPMVQWVLGMSVLDCGARQAWALTSDRYGPGELWRLGKSSQPVAAPTVLVQYREDG
jgi:hypothetical protein